MAAAVPHEVHALADGATAEVSLAAVGRRCFCLHARMAARSITRRYNAALAPLGLEITEFSLLAALAGGGAPSIAALAERLAFERTTLVRNLKRLALRQLIERVERNGRAVQYALTAPGSRLLEQAVPLWAAVHDSVAARLGDGGAAAVLAELERLRCAAGR